MRERLRSELQDRDSVIRQLFARVARGEAKNFFALHVGTELEKFERELQQRRERALAELGSAAPGTTCVDCSVPQPAPCLCDPHDMSPQGQHPECTYHGDPVVLAQLKENL
jgi:hypothetical protein